MAGQGKPSKTEGLATTADIGLTHKDIHDARQVRDAEAADPDHFMLHLCRVEPPRASENR